MQTRVKRFSVIGGFLILLAILIADAYITKRQLDQQIETGLWVNHTRQVQLADQRSRVASQRRGNRTARLSLHRRTSNILSPTIGLSRRLTRISMRSRN